MKVVEIFKSIDGEGIRAGFPVTFIRLFGCNLACNYCDSTYATGNSPVTPPEDGKWYEDMDVDDILDEVFKLGCKRITLTGGEPLIHDDVDVLISRLCQEGYEINIETNGSILIYKYRQSNVFFTLDYKCPCSGMECEMDRRNLKLLRSQDVLKFVVATKQDLDRALTVSNYTSAQVFISPVFGKIQPVEIVEYMLEHNMQDARVQVQLHKIIWDPNKRGV